MQTIEKAEISNLLHGIRLYANHLMNDVEPRKPVVRSARLISIHHLLK